MGIVLYGCCIEIPLLSLFCLWVSRSHFISELVLNNSAVVADRLVALCYFKLQIIKCTDATN